MTTLSLAPGSLIVEISRLLESRTLFLFSPSELPPPPRPGLITAQVRWTKKPTLFQIVQWCFFSFSPLSNLDPGTD